MHLPTPREGPPRRPARRLVSRSIRFAILMTLISAGTLAAATDGSYVVRNGDSLGRIASRCGTSVAEISRRNELAGDVVHVGQVLRISAPFQKVLPDKISWRHPFEGRPGRVLRPYGAQAGSVVGRRTGSDIAYALGGAVLAPANGLVRYVGSQAGYGTLAIIDHGGDYTTVLGPLDPEHLAIETGRIVLKGESLGRCGAPVEGKEPYLHVELRCKSEAVDPSRLLR
ncbi:MAG: LysM peptidoglycan-binding domain-containing M23 family metallopeptidase [bacterium]|nr:LysM peptidoglycan-binding domain-containing M23 family metallopeptidase [bacterium]